MGGTALLIANPAAGFRRADARAERGAAKLASLGLRAELYRTGGPGDAEEAARRAAGVFDMVVAAGGDGTANEVANGLALSNTPMGVLPLGSMNILAREVGMPLDVDGACGWLARAEPEPIALGMRDNRYFALMAGIGYDAHCLKAALDRARAGRRKVRFTDYAMAAVLDAGSYVFPPIEIAAQGRSRTCAFAIVSNCPRYGANLRIGSAARLEEPVLHAVLFPDGRFLSRVRVFGALLAGRHLSLPGVAGFLTERLDAAAAGGMVPCQLDGEVSEPLPACFRAVPGALYLLRRSKAS